MKKSKKRGLGEIPTCVKRHRFNMRCIEWSDGWKGALRGASTGVMTGSWCEKKLIPKSKVDRRSFRWVKKGKNWLLIACPKGSWKPRAKKCEVGTRAAAILTPANGRCPRGRRRIKKG